MATSQQKSQLHERLKTYRKRYLQKRYGELDESGTRLMVNSFLTDVLGYKELEDIKTEYRIRGEYADYVVQLARKRWFVVEVKSVQLDLNEKHLRQSVNYAANEGIDWIVLTNGKTVDVYRVLFTKPIQSKKIFGFNLIDRKELKQSVDFLIYLTKRSILKNEVDQFWKRFQALEPMNLSRNLYSREVVNYLKRILRKQAQLSFSDDDILDSVFQIITTKLQSVRPKNPVETKR